MSSLAERLGIGSRPKPAKARPVKIAVKERKEAPPGDRTLLLIVLLLGLL